VQAGGNGFVALWPLDAPTPGTSVVSYVAGSTRASSAVLPVTRDGFASLVVHPTVAGGGSVHLVVDVSGYFE
jgi:hypothetical protein